MEQVPVYTESVSSRRTQALFVVFTLLWLAAFAVRAAAMERDWLTNLFLGLALFFLFYALNYRTLLVVMSAEHLQLRFGLFRWTIPWNTVDHCRQDETTLWRMGGAGIHFTFIRRRYRAMFNFLEHPRVVIALRQRRGPVWDVVFSTRNPEEVMRLVRAAAAAHVSG